jgi:hypothetical protein
MYLERTERLQTALESWDLNNLPMLPEKFETKVVENSGIQKQFKIIKNYSTKPNWSSTAGMQDRRRTHSALGHERSPV